MKRTLFRRSLFAKGSFACLCAALAGGACGATTDTAWTSNGCYLNIGSLGYPLYPFMHSTSWIPTTGYGKNALLDDGTFAFTLDSGTCVIDGRYSCVRVADNALLATWTLTPRQDVSLGSLAVSCHFDRASFAGGRITLDATSVELPPALGRSTLADKSSISTIRAYDGQGTLRATFALASPLRTIVQDAREWGTDAYSFRVQPNGTQSFKAGVPVTLALTLTLPNAVVLIAPEQYVAKADADWIPMPSFAWPRAGTPLDFSRLRGTDAPAGRHGRVVRRGAHFEFENLPGVSQRFYGANLVQATVTPTAGEAECAAGLARLGFNAVRIHHHGTYLVKGATDGDPGATTLSPAQLDRFERLVAACVTNGLYLTTDLYVSRSPVTWRSLGFDRDGSLASADFKALVLVHEPTYSNLVTFTRRFFTHVNPYLGRSLADEPAMIGVSLVNEGAISTTPNALVAAYPPWQTAWDAWIAAKKASESATYGAVSSTVPSSWTPAFRRFVQEKEAAFAARMTQFLRDDLGCRAPLTSLNGCAYPAAYMQVRAACYDYQDDHYYYDHPSFLETKWALPSSLKNTNPLVSATAGVMALAARRHFGMPYVVTEYNYCGPNQYRALGGLLAGALGAAQDWDGLWRFAWQHGGTDIAHPTSAIGAFDLAGDPLNLASERAAVCLFLRGDLPPLEKAGAMLVRPESVDRPTTEAGTTVSLAALRLAWYARLGHVVSNAAPAGVVSLGAFEVARTNAASVIAARLGVTEGAAPLPSATVDSADGSLRVVTPRTCGGFVPSGTLDAGALSVTEADVPATIWASALDDAPLASSRHVLVTHLTDALNTGMTFDDASRTTLRKYGARPHLMRRGTAHVRLALAPGCPYRVRALAPDGTTRRRVDATVTHDGHVSFVCDVAAEQTATWLYEVTASGLSVLLR